VTKGDKEDGHQVIGPGGGSQQKRELESAGSLLLVVL
jgi:hypothetical protein